jgi:hypothetical protein
MAMSVFTLMLAVALAPLNVGRVLNPSAAEGGRSAPTPATAPLSAVEKRAEAVAAFATVQKVLQHPRCQNCHIPGDAPLQFDAGLPHQMKVVRGPDGNGAPGLGCATCHNVVNPPASYGPHAPPGAPGWFLPPPDRKMVFINLSPAELCAVVKDPKKNGGKDFAALIKHVDKDKLVLWGWHPGGNRAPVSVPHEEFVAKFKQWAAAGGPCPGDALISAASRPNQAGTFP